MSEKQTKFLRRLASSELLVALLVAITLIIVSVGLGWENNKIVPVNPASTAHYNLEPTNRLSFLSDWDGPIYLSIAEHGYTNKNQANFFPLYPMLVHVAHLVIPSLLDSGLIVAWLCFVGALYYYLKILKSLYRLEDNLEALKGMLFFALFPTGIFLIATYTESLFAFLALGAIYYALQNKYLASAAFAMFLTATHVNGVFVVALIGLILLGKKLNPLKILLTMAIGCLGLVSYLIYQSVRFHNPLEFIQAQKAHHWVSLSAGHLVHEVATLNGIFLLLVLCSALYWWQRRKSFSLYSLFYLAIIFIGGKNFSGFGRYSLMVFPLEIMLYDYFKDKKLGYTIGLTLSAILWTFMMLRYVGGYTGG